MAYLPIKKSRFRPFFKHFYEQNHSCLALKKPILEKKDPISAVQNTPLSSQVNVIPVVNSPSTEDIDCKLKEESKEEMELKKTLQTKVQYDHKIKDAMTKDERENNTMLEGGCDSKLNLNTENKEIKLKKRKLEAKNIFTKFKRF